MRTIKTALYSKVCLIIFCYIFSFLLIPFFSAGQTCNNWVRLPDQPSYIRIGDLDVTGNKITVEALINRTAPWNGSDLFQGDVVSKHEDPKDCNYLLRPSSAEITTTNGYYKTPTICPIQLNKTYHVAMVYDGKALKFYRNGFLMSQIAASGNMVLNDWQTQIGLYFNQTTKENFIGYINEVRIWNVARTQEEINSFMSGSLPAPQSTPGLLAYYTFDNLLNKQGNAAWNGKLGGSASINQSNPDCKLVADSCGILPCDKPLFPDFSFSQDVCNPKSVQFSADIKDIKLYEWDFGNGQVSSGNASPSVKYADFNVYNVKLRVKNEEGCKDSITKSIVVNVQQADVIVTSDTTICIGDSVILRTVNEGLEFCWLPATGLDNAKVRQPTAKPVTTTTYSLTTKTIGSNLIINGDFSNGNKDFQSDYAFANSGLPAGVYNVGNDIRAWHPGMVSCTDHTTGSGNMMMVNGADKRGAKVWTQTIAIKPNTNYVFSTWLQTITTINPAQLQFSINGQTIGDVINASSQSCLWKQFYSTWNSGANTSATITIINLNELFSGNDFALDDIFFGEVMLKQEFITIKVASKPEITMDKDVTVCTGASLALKATTKGARTITWSPAIYIDDVNSFSPMVTPAKSTKYIAEVTNSDGCFNKDSVSITVLEKPTLTLRTDTMVCQGTPLALLTSATNATTFQWAPADGLSDPAALSPIAKPIKTTQYTVTASNAGCSATGQMLLMINPAPELKVNNDTLVCEASLVPLAAEGNAVRYEWNPVPSLSNRFIANPIAMPAATTTYKVSAWSDNGCVAADSVTVSVVPQPVFKIVPEVQAICIGDSATLRVEGADSYSWSPAPMLLSENGAIARVYPSGTTLFKVQATHSICNKTDSLFATVRVNPLPVGTISKSNDINCTISAAQLSAGGGSTYKWFSNSSLSNHSIANPVVTPNKTTTYSVEISSVEGCSVKDSITVQVVNTGILNFHVPTAFTPNNDGKNDCFSARYNGQPENFSLAIYNRWGEKVFYSTNIAQCWDGRYKGRELPGGVYVFYIKAKTFCGDIVRKGTLLLIR